MRFVITESKSVYEIDNENNQIRRVMGVKDPTQRTGADGIWRAFESVAKLPGGNMLIVWPNSTPPLIDGDETVIAKTTMTSRIIKEADTMDDLVAVN